MRLCNHRAAQRDVEGVEKVGKRPLSALRLWRKELSGAGREPKERPCDGLFLPEKREITLQKATPLFNSVYCGLIK